MAAATTSPMSSAQVERFLRRRYGSRVRAVTLLGAGDWSAAYAFTVDGRELVARFGAHGDDFAKDAQMGRLGRRPGLPIPAVVATGELEIGGRPGFFAISERAHGQFLDELDEEAMRSALPAVLAGLAVLRGIDVSQSVGYGWWRPDGSAPHHSWPAALLAVVTDAAGSRIHGWRRALAGSPTGAAPFDAAVDALRGLVRECPPTRQLIHGDLLHRNVLIDRSVHGASTDGTRVSAVLDWGNSMYGDGLYDLAWLRYWWRWYPAWHRIDVADVIGAHLDATGERSPDVDQRLRCYQIYIGLEAQAYNAFTGRWAELARNARQTMDLVLG